MGVPVPSWPSFRRFASVTTGLTLLLVMLGIYTASGAYGGGCGAYWLTCNGNLFPQTYPAFIEWLHRLVAMITGWFILGTALWAWMSDQSQATKGSAALGAVLLPVQVILGAVTIQVYSQDAGFPLISAKQWATVIFASHYVTAVLIFLLLVATTVFAYRGHYAREPASRVILALAGSLTLLPLNTLLSRVVTVVPYSQIIQPIFFGLSLLLFGLLLATTIWIGETRHIRLRPLLVTVLSLLFVHLLLGVGVVAYTTAIRYLNGGIMLAIVGITIAVTWRVYRHTSIDDANVSGPIRSG